MRTIHLGEKGATLILVLAFMALAIPLTTATLGLASTLSIDSRLKTARMKSHYNTMGAAEHAMYRLQYEAGYVESLPLGQPASYTIVLNGANVSVMVTKTNEPPPPEAVPGGLTNRAFSIAKSAFPNAVPADTQTTFTYAVVLSNMTEDTKTVTKIRDDFPQGLTYTPGSTSGLTTSEPDIVSSDLRWSLTSAEGTLAPFTNKTLQFQMQGSLPEGVHCNDIWVSPGGDKTRSGLTAKIVAGLPASTLCSGTAVQLAKTVTPQVVPSNTQTTFTYTITLVNDGTNSSDVSKITDVMPPGFSYVVASTQGLTTADPSIKLVIQGTQEELSWTGAPLSVVAPGQTLTLTLQAVATLQVEGSYNEVTATVSGLNYDLYTWPNARVEVVGVFDMSSTDNDTTTSAVPRVLRRFASTRATNSRIRTGLTR